MESNEKTHHIIINGHFSRNGNFIGIDSNDKEIHIYEKQLNLHNLKCKQDIAFPLFAIGAIKVFDKLSGEPGDEDRKPTLNTDGVKETFKRLTAMVVFKSFDALIDAYASDIAQNQKSIDYLKAKAESLGVKDLGTLDFNSELDEIKENSIKAENAFKEFIKYKILSNKK